MKFQGLKLRESAQKTAPKWELLDAFLKKCLLYVVKVNLPSIFWAKIQPKRWFSGILGIWYGFPIGQRCSNSKERLCVCKRKKYLAQTCQKASKTLHTGMLLGWNLGKKFKKKFFDMLFGHAQRSQKTCCIRFKANINPHFPVLAVFNSCGTVSVLYSTVTAL